jgi:hypothetical protein
MAQEVYERISKERVDMTEEELRLAADHEAYLAARRIDKERK